MMIGSLLKELEKGEDARRAKSWRGKKKEKGSFPSFFPFYFCTRTFSIQLTRPSRSLDQAINSMNNRSDSDS